MGRNDGQENLHQRHWRKEDTQPRSLVSFRLDCSRTLHSIFLINQRSFETDEILCDTPRGGNLPETTPVLTILGNTITLFVTIGNGIMTSHLFPSLIKTAI